MRKICNCQYGKNDKALLNEKKVAKTVCKTSWKMGGREKECSFCLYKETRGNTQKNLRQWLLVGIGMWGLGRWQTAMGGRKTFITNLFTLLDFFDYRNILPRFFFFKPRRDIVFICFLENLLLLQGRGCTQEGGGGQGEQWGRKEGVPLPREDINKHHLKFSAPRHCQDPGGGWATAGSLLPSLSRDVDHLPLWWCSRAPGVIRSVALFDAAPSPPCSWAGRGNAWKGAALGNRAQIWALWPPLVWRSRNWD